MTRRIHPRACWRAKRFPQENLEIDRIHSGRFESSPGLPQGLTRGTFGADMQVFSQNDGPVTILFDTDHM